MRIGTSRADRLGFAVFMVLAGILAVLLIRSFGNDSTEAAQEVSTLGSFTDPTPVPTTAAIAMPTATPFVPAAAPVQDATDEVEDAEDAEDEPDSSTADGDNSTDAESAADTPGAGTGETAASAPAPAEQSTEAGTVPNPQPAATTVPNPQPAATTVPNPQPAATTVPNPQPAATTVPNPQPAATTVPNPQPAVQQPVNVPAPAPQGGSFTHTLTAIVPRPTLYTSPGGSPFTPTFNGTALPPVNPTVFGNPLVYRVLAGSPDDGSGWAQVNVPARPNGTTAWVQTSQFRWGSSNRMLQVNISTNTVTVFEGSNVLLTTQAVTGKPSSPTPRANGWVEEIMAGPSSAYGPRLISLGIFSDALNSFGGSIPKIALHGTDNPGLMGQYASNGCIRVRNEVINQIAGMLPVGSKVQLVG